MEGAEKELERRSKFLSSLIERKKATEQQKHHDHLLNIKVRASDMPIALQNKAFKCARDHLDSVPPGTGKKIDSKRLALALKKEFDSLYGPAWHCIVGTSFGSYVTHSLGAMDLEISHDTELKEHKLCDKSSEIGGPHEALFLVLSYLPLFELLAMSAVCRSLRDALNNDILPWLNIIVQEKNSRSRVSDDILMRITSKAMGRLKTLVLVNCVNITDDGLQAVIAKNPHIIKLEVPQCTSLTPDGIIRAVTTLNLHHPTLKKLKINGIYNITKEHLATLHSLLRTSQRRQRRFYPEHKSSTSKEEDTDPSSIDVEICQKCDEVRMVFDCPTETCERKRMMQECRGCKFCIPRCEECGKCVGYAEEQETEAACEDTLCADCWIHLPKCDFCNKPYCNQHGNKQYFLPGSCGFLCEVCYSKIEQF